MTMPALAAALIVASPAPAPAPAVSAHIVQADAYVAHATVPVLAPVIRADAAQLADFGAQDPTLGGVPDTATAEAATDAMDGTEGTEAPPAEDPDSDNNVIVVQAVTEAPPGDPLHQINAQTYAVVQGVDQAVVEPLATAYNEKLPRPVRSGLSNFFRNLREPIVFLNFLLQGKPGKAAETAGRFAINSTVGFGGLFDVAKREPFNLPHRRNGFANTLGYYGVGQGPFFYLPLVGATTLRDGIGSLADTAVLPFAIGRPFNTPYYAVSSYTVRSLDERREFHERHQRIADSNFPYETMRETYLCDRTREIEALHGRPPSDCMPEAMKDLPGEPDFAPAPPAE